MTITLNQLMGLNQPISLDAFDDHKACPCGSGKLVVRVARVGSYQVPVCRKCLNKVIGANGAQGVRRVA